MQLHIKRGDGKWIAQKFWVCPDLTHRALIGRPLLQKLGYKMELDFTYVHKADINRQIVDPESDYFEKIDYFDNNYYQILNADKDKMEKVKSKFDKIKNPEMKKLLEEFWEDCKNNISKSRVDVGFIDCDPLEINLKQGTKPVYIKARPMNKEKEAFLKQILKQMEDAGIICQAKSPWGCPAFLVEKPNYQDKKDWRVVVDYKPLNKVTITEQHPIPNIQDTLIKLQGKKCISLLDIKSGFYHLPIAEYDRYKTAFTTPFGSYAFKRVPMGLKNSPMAFQRCLNHLFKDCKNVMIYIDDIIIASETEEQHVQDVKAVRLMRLSGKVEFWNFHFGILLLVL